jgi:chaperone modulatory protein CbpM
MEIHEFLVNARLDRENVEAWIEAGWLIPGNEGKKWVFSGVDIARAQLIRDLKTDMGVNDEGVAIILNLLDQLYGLWATVNGIASAIAAQEGTLKQQLLAAIRGCPSDPDRDWSAALTRGISGVR